MLLSLLLDYPAMTNAGMAYGQNCPTRPNLDQAAIALAVKSGRYPDFPVMAARQTSGDILLDRERVR